MKASKAKKIRNRLYGLDDYRKRRYTNVGGTLYADPKRRLYQRLKKYSKPLQVHLAEMDEQERGS